MYPSFSSSEKADQKPTNPSTRQQSSPETELKPPENLQPSTSEVKAGSDGPSMESPAEKRLAPRRKKMLQVLIQDAEGIFDPFPGWIADRSLGGLCMLVDQPIEPGTVLKVRRSNTPANVPWVEVQVLNARMRETSWELGCQFVRSPTWDVLMQFG